MTGNIITIEKNTPQTSPGSVKKPLKELAKSNSLLKATNKNFEALDDKLAIGLSIQAEIKNKGKEKIKKSETQIQTLSLFINIIIIDKTTEIINTVANLKLMVLTSKHLMRKTIKPILENKGAK